MSPWQGFTSSPGMMSGGPQGYMGTGSMSNMQNQFGGGGSGVGSSAYGAMYDNPFTTAFAMQRTNVLARPKGAHFAGFQAHADNIAMGTGAAMTATGMEMGGSLAGGVAGAAMGSAILPGIGTLIGGIAGSMLGGSAGEMAGGAFANRAGAQTEVHRSLMGLANPSSPYGGGFGMGKKDTKDIFRGMEKMAGDDPYFGMGDISRILDEGIKSGNIKGGSGSGDIKSKLKGLKETAKSLVEIFGDSDISEIMDTLRRLNGTGMSNSQAVQTSRTIGMAARAMGMKEGDMFNRVSQDSQAKADAGIMTEGDALINDSTNLLAFKYSGDLKDRFTGNDDFIKKAGASMSKYTKLLSGNSGAHMLATKNEASEAALMAIAEATAKTNVGGKEAFTNLSREDQVKERQKAMTQVINQQKNGVALTGMVASLSANGTLEEKDRSDILHGNTVALTKRMSPVSTDYTTGDDYVKNQGDRQARVIKKAYNDTIAQYYSGTSVTEQDKYVADVLDQKGEAQYKSAINKEVQGEQASAMSKSGSFDSRWQAMLTQMSSAWGQFTEDIVGKTKMALTGMQTGPAASAASMSATVNVANSSSIAQMYDDKASPTFDSADMVTTGDRGTSISNSWSWRSNEVNTMVRGMAHQAGLDKGSLGTMNVEELSAMTKSGFASEASRIEGLNETDQSFKPVIEGSKSMAELSSEMTEIGGDGYTKKLEAFATKVKTSNLKGADGMNTAVTDINNDGADIFNTGSATRYGLSVLSNESEQSLFGLDLLGGDAKARGKQTQTVDDMVLLNKTGQKHNMAVKNAMSVASSVDFEQLKADIGDLGSRDGVAQYLEESGVGKDLDKQSKAVLSQALRAGHGDKTKTKEAFRYQAGTAKETIRSGTNFHSTMRTLGFKVEGSVSKQQIDRLGKELEFAGTRAVLDKTEEDTSPMARRLKGYQSIIREQQGFADDKEGNAKALEIMHAQGRQLQRTSGEQAMASQQPFSTMGRLFKQKDTVEEQESFGSNLVKDAVALDASSQMLGKTESEKKAIFQAAQTFGSLSGGDDGALVMPANVKKWKNDHSDMSKEDILIAQKLSRVDKIKGISFKEFSSATGDGAMLDAAKKTAENVFGKSLNTKNEVAQSLGLLGTFKQGADGKFASMTDTELMQKEKVARSKDFKERDFTERALVNAADNYKKRTHHDADATQLSAQMFTDAGISGMTRGSVADKMNGSARSLSEDLLSQINQNLVRLVQKAENPAGKSQNNNVYGDGGDGNMGGANNPIVTDISLNQDTEAKKIPVSKSPEDTVRQDAPIEVSGGNKQAKPIKGNEPATTGSDKAPPPAPTPVAYSVEAITEKKNKSGDMYNPTVGGSSRSTVVSKKGVSFDGLQKDTAKLMLVASRSMASDGHSMIVTSGTDRPEGYVGPNGKPGKSKHEDGKAFDIGIKSFKNKDEARAAGKKALARMQKGYTGGIEAIEEKGHIHFEFNDDKEKSGYIEDNKAMDATKFGQKRKASNLQSVQLGVGGSAKSDAVDAIGAKAPPKLKATKEEAEASKKTMKELYKRATGGLRDFIDKRTTDRANDDRTMHHGDSLVIKEQIKTDRVKGKTAKTTVLKKAGFDKDGKAYEHITTKEFKQNIKKPVSRHKEDSKDKVRESTQFGKNSFVVSDTETGESSEYKKNSKVNSMTMVDKDTKKMEGSIPLASKSGEKDGPHESTQFGKNSFTVTDTETGKSEEYSKSLKTNSIAVVDSKSKKVESVSDIKPMSEKQVSAELEKVSPGKGSGGPKSEAFSAKVKGDIKAPSYKEYQDSITGGDVAMQKTMSSKEDKKTKGDTKRDMASQTTSLLERIAKATEAVSSAMSGSAPVVKKQKS